MLVADSGTSVSIIPVNIAKRNGIKWRRVNPDEPNYSGITGTQPNILGQTNIWIKFTTMKKAQEISALVCQEQSEESLIDIDSLKDMGIIHKDFPLPIDESMRESPHKIRLVNTEIKTNSTNLVDILERQRSMRSSLKFNPVNEDTSDMA